MARHIPTIAISGCLLGEEIRHDGQHKRHPHVIHDFSAIFNFHSFCPEVRMGLGIPRPAIRLVSSGDKIELVQTKDVSANYTDRAYETFEKMLPEIEEMDGIVFAKNSPTCGYDPIKVYNKKNGHPESKSKGLWAQKVADHYKNIPKIDSGRLYDDHLRDTFVTQVQIYHNLTKNITTPAELLKSHQDMKYYLLQYGDKYLKTLGRICAGVTKSNFKETHTQYCDYLFQEVFQAKITIKRRVNVAEHIAGYFKNNLSKSDKNYLHNNIKAYHQKKISFETLIVLIYFLVNTYDEKYLKDQLIFKFYTKHKEKNEAI